MWNFDQHTATDAMLFFSARWPPIKLRNDFWVFQHDYIAPFFSFLNRSHIGREKSQQSHSQRFCFTFSLKFSSWFSKLLLSSSSALYWSNGFAFKAFPRHVAEGWILCLHAKWTRNQIFLEDLQYNNAQSSSYKSIFAQLLYSLQKIEFVPWQSAINFRFTLKILSC